MTEMTANSMVFNTTLLQGVCRAGGRVVSREAPGSPTGSQGGCDWGSSMFHPTPTSVHNLPGASGRQAAQRVSPQLRPSQQHLPPVRSLQ